MSAPHLMIRRGTGDTKETSASKFLTSSTWVVVTACLSRGLLSMRGALLGAMHLSSSSTTKTARYPGCVKGIKDKKNQLMWWSGEAGKIVPSNLRKRIWIGDQSSRVTVKE